MAHKNCAVEINVVYLQPVTHKVRAGSETHTQQASTTLHSMEHLDTYKTLISQHIKEKAYRDADFTAARLAEMIGVRDYTLSRIMKKAFGKSFTAMVNELRVKDAMRYLKDPRLQGTRVDDIGSMVGFGNRQTFHTEFRRQTGFTPAQYRQTDTGSGASRSRAQQTPTHQQNEK